MLHDDLVFLLILVAIAEVCLGSSSVVSGTMTELGVQNHVYDNHVPSCLVFPFNQGLQELGKMFLKREKNKPIISHFILGNVRHLRHSQKVADDFSTLQIWG